MAELKITSQIVDKDTKVFLSWDGFESTTSDDIVRFLDSLGEEDKTINIHINCEGGNVTEGWRIYDLLRRSGKEITATVEGLCASMATVVLLAAPKERRFAFQNSSFCIHNPEACWLDVDYYNRLTADNIDAMAEKMKLQADSLRAEQQKILDLYVERTGCDAETLQKLMNDDVIITMQKAKELGFISDTLAPNTASLKHNFQNYLKPSQKMAKNEAKTEVGSNLLTRMLAKLGFSSLDEVKFNDLTLTAADGTELTVEREEGQPEVGDAAEPDGSFVMEDGSTIVVSGGVITEIKPAEEDKKITDPETGEELSVDEAQVRLNELKQKVDDLNAQLEAKNNEAADSASKITELEASVASQTETIAELQKSVVTDEQKQILDSVNKAGGAEWLAKMASLQSHGEPLVPQQNLSHKDDVKKVIIDAESYNADAKKRSKRYR